MQPGQTFAGIPLQLQTVLVNESLTVSCVIKGNSIGTRCCSEICNEREVEGNECEMKTLSPMTVRYSAMTVRYKATNVR